MVSDGRNEEWAITENNREGGWDRTIYFEWNNQRSLLWER